MQLQNQKNFEKFIDEQVFSDDEEEISEHTSD